MSTFARGFTGLLFAMFFIPPLLGQTKCPPLPEGVACDHYHYHVSLWNVANRAYDEVALTRQFVSMATCEAARAADLKQNQALSDFVKNTKIDTSMLPNRFSGCHCDLTQEPSSPAFLDARARLAQLRTYQDVIWSLREHLLSRDVPATSEYVTALFDRPLKLDRFFREPFPPRTPLQSASHPPAQLLDSTLRGEGQAPPIAANLSLAPVPVPPASAKEAPQSQPAASKPAGQPSPVQPPAPPPPAAEVHPPSEKE